MQTGKLFAGDRPLVDHVEIACGFFDRLRGLLGRSGMMPGSAMIIERCGAVHTIGMRFPLDLIFLDNGWRVISVKRDVRPGRPMISGGMRARRVVEIQAGSLDLNGIKPGDQTVLQLDE